MQEEMTKDGRTWCADEKELRPILSQDHWPKLVENVRLEVLNDFQSDNGLVSSKLEVELPPTSARREGRGFSKFLEDTHGAKSDKERTAVRSPSQSETSRFVHRRGAYVDVLFDWSRGSSEGRNCAAKRSRLPRSISRPAKVYESTRRQHL